jgi:hypothetical protein
VYFVYALTDPRTDEIRYIGLAKNVRRRLYHHMYYRGGSSVKDSWIEQLLHDGLTPSVEVLETVEDENTAREREAYWIRYYSQRGEQLTNVQRHAHARPGKRAYSRGRGYYCSQEEIDEELNIRAGQFAVNWDGSD